MKKFMCLLLAALMLFATACSGSGDGEKGDASADSVAELSSGDTAAVADKITVPDITGKSREEAEKMLSDAGFTVKVKEKPYDDVPEGEVAEIDLKVGESYDKGTKVWLFVSTGKSLAASTLEYKQSALVESREKLEQGANSDYEPINYTFMRACWLSQYDMGDVYCKGGLQRDEEEFRALIKELFSAIADRGINTLIVQLRPNGDSFYPSEYYCPSNYVTGGYYIDFKYDPLTIMVEEAHALKLSIHGWINPMRCMEPSLINGVNISYGVRKFEQEHPGDYIVEYNGRYYLNPGREEVRQLIIDGAAEIVRYHDVDGVHMDDYFYPTGDRSFDKQSYEDQKDEYVDVPFFRKDSLNKLVSGIYSAVKAENPKVMFGISPAGNITNVRNASADIDTWLSHEGYVDYIMPQLYFGLENGNSSYDTLYDKWSDLVKVDTIRMIPGLTLQHAAEGATGKSTAEWNTQKDVLKRSVQYSYKKGNCSGFSLFSLSYILGPTTCTETPTTKKELDNLFEFAMTVPCDELK